MYVMKQSGWVEVICGSMFSGKSEELIRQIRHVLFAKQNIMVFKPEIDTRYAETEIVSHNGNKVTAIPIKDANDIFNYITEQTDVIAIDEVQFFDMAIVQTVQQLATQGYRVIVAGLDQDFRGEPFHPMPELMAISESVTKLHAVCAVCGSPASCTQRLINQQPAHYDDEIVVLGAHETYEPRCRHCHQVIKNNKEK